MPTVPHSGLRRWALLALFFALATAVGAQEIIVSPGTGSGNRPFPISRGDINSRSTSRNNSSPFATSTDSTFVGDTAATTGLQNHVEEPDSLLRKRVFIFFYKPLSVKIDSLWNPSLSPTGVQYADRVDALNGNYYIGKGFLGHPHYAVAPNLASGIGASFMPNTNVAYAKTRQNIRLYQAMMPYTQLGYHSSIDKDYAVHIAHTQNIIPGWNVSFDYTLLRPEGTYTSSGAKNHYLDATTNYFSKDARLQATTGVIWQHYSIDENGGISDDSYFTQQLISNRAGVPVNIYNAGSVHNNLYAFGSASYNMVRQFEHYRHRDSIAFRTEADTLVADTIDVVDTLRVGKPHVINAGVWGIEVAYDRQRRRYADSTLWRFAEATLFWTNDAYADHRWHNPLKVTVGITPHVSMAAVMADTIRSTSFIDPFVHATLCAGRLSLTGKAEARGALNQTGAADSRASLMLRYAADSAGHTRFALEAATQHMHPDVLMLHDALYGQNLRLRQIASQRYALSFQHTDAVDVELRATHLSHNAWYDTALLVHEGANALWLYQGRITLRLHIAWLHCDMQQIVQHTTDEVQMPVPLFASKNSVYANLDLFGHTMRAQLGVDVRYHSPFYAPTYNAPTGLFVHQDEQQVGGYIWADVFLNINVKRASFYVKAGHVNAVWESNPTYFILPHYPGKGFGLYWGISWQFFD